MAAFNLLPLRSMAVKFASTGVASWGCVMVWGALFHFTAGILIPALVTGFMEKRERRQFLHEEASKSPSKVKDL